MELTKGRVARAIVVLLTVVVALAPQGVSAEPQGDVVSADPKLVRDGDRWVALGTNAGLNSTQARACDPEDPVWDKGFAYVPYRVGSRPGRLGDCLAGDALPGGPGPWADRPPDTGMYLWAPSMAEINGVWWLFYMARKAGTGQQCIGVAAGDRSTGPNWLHKQEPLICPGNGQWAIDPEIFYDRQTRAWYLLWHHGPLNIQRFDPKTATLTGPVRALLQKGHRDLGFDEYVVDGEPVSVIENPAMVRADSGQLWLFFAANRWQSGDYATGWAVCGDGSPVEGEGCGLINSFDPKTRYRPYWGWSQRAAPAGGVNAKPVEAFPDLPGFGGMSITETSPITGERQPIYAATHIWNGPGTSRSMHVHRLDTGAVAPVLREP